MSNAEHLIENAIEALIDGEDFEDYASRDYNISMAKRSNINLEDVWQMAWYVKDVWIDKNWE